MRFFLRAGFLTPAPPPPLLPRESLRVSAVASTSARNLTPRGRITGVGDGGGGADGAVPTGLGGNESTPVGAGVSDTGGVGAGAGAGAGGGGAKSASKSAFSCVKKPSHTKHFPLKDNLFSTRLKRACVGFHSLANNGWTTISAFSAASARGSAIRPPAPLFFLWATIDRHTHKKSATLKCGHSAGLFKLTEILYFFFMLTTPFEKL